MDRQAATISLVAEPTEGNLPAESEHPRDRAAAALIGRTISDRYKIVALVAMGGMGAVYRAEHLLMRKHVAVKVLHPDTEGFPELAERFEREAVAGAHIDHPNVATASDFGRFDGGSCFLVLEFIRGVTLRDLIDRGPLAAPRSARIIRQVAAALAAVHAKGIVHRDIKPRNIMIIDETRLTRRVQRGAGQVDVVKLIDFGLSKVPVEELSVVARDVDGDGDRRSLTAAGVVVGTVGYLAPEAALGMRSVLAAADLYSLGVTFYEMLCGKPPFEATDQIKLFSQHRTAPVPPMAEKNPEARVPAALEAIARRLLEKDPGDRYPSAGALIEALDAALEPAPPRAAAVVPHDPVTLAGAAASSAGGIGARRAWGLAALVVAVGGVVAYLASGGSAPEVSSSTAASVAREESAPARETASASGAHAAPPRAPSAVERLHAAAEAQDGAGAVAVFLDLADKERAAFADRAVQSEAARVAEIAAASGHAADPIFDRLGNALGTDGLDILYDLAARELRSGDPLERTGLAPPKGAGPRARAILGRPETLARATPAMRVAYELRRASCQHRPNLFPRAATDGDDRALEILTSMQPPACSRKDACCLPKHRELERAVAEIQARLRH